MKRPNTINIIITAFLVIDAVFTWLLSQKMNNVEATAIQTDQGWYIVYE